MECSLSLLLVVGGDMEHWVSGWADLGDGEWVGETGDSVWQQQATFYAMPAILEAGSVEPGIP